MYDARKHICFNLGRVMRRVYDYYEHQLSSFGLTSPQYFVFNALWMGDGISVGQLGERVSLDSSTLTGIIDRMERSGYVERRLSPDDRRSVLVFLEHESIGSPHPPSSCRGRGLGSDPSDVVRPFKVAPGGLK